MFLLVILTFMALLAFIAYKTWNATQFWKKRSVKYKTRITILADLWNFTFRKESIYESIITMYKEFPEARYHGVYQFIFPTIVIKDVDLIKQICVKDFDSFMNHRQSISNLIELFSKNLIGLGGEEWRQMRAHLSPAFTSSKMKAMFHLICECADSLSKYYSEKGEYIIELELKNLFTKYTNDVIATCAFGVQCDSIRDDKNEFYLMGKDATNFNGGFRTLKVALFTLFPKICEFFQLEVFPKAITDFFLNIVKDTIAYRTEHAIVRPDMIHLLMEARKGKLKHEEEQDTVDNSFAASEESEIGKTKVKTKKEIRDIDIAAQAFIFFFAGFETSSTVMSFMAMELALNPDIQGKLFQEIKEVMEKNNNKPNYEAINNMKYLDMVVSESLRKWPATPITDRACNEEFTIEGVEPDELSLTLQAGEMITIPILGLHRDGKYFPDPQKFDPERFSDERKHEIVPFSYLPFGVGPRSCIGSRFALLEIKILFTYLLARMELTVIKKTIVPMVLSKKTFIAQPDGGFWVGLKMRE